jgi:hypothetical protein
MTLGCPVTASSTAPQKQLPRYECLMVFLEVGSSACRKVPRALHNGMQGGDDKRSLFIRMVSRTHALAEAVRIGATALRRRAPGASPKASHEDIL